MLAATSEYLSRWGSAKLRGGLAGPATITNPWNLLSLARAKGSGPEDAAARLRRGVRRARLPVSQW